MVGSFDLAVSLFSGAPANPPSDDSINAQRDGLPGGRGGLVAPGDPKYGKAAFYAHPAPDGFSRAGLAPATAHWKEGLGEYVPDRYDCRDEL